MAADGTPWAKGSAGSRTAIQRALPRLQAWLHLFHRRSFSFLSIQSDDAGWVLDEEARALRGIATRLGLPNRINLGLGPRARQCVHYTSQFVFREPAYFATNHRISVDYFHGHPAADPAFADTLAGLKKHYGRLARLRVSHSRIENMVLETGIDPLRVRRIPIGVDLSRFPPRDATSRRAARDHLGIPSSAVVVGSFQKDGVGWGEGREPKLIKGPDVFLRTVEALKPRLPELWVLLTGPARGFVREGLSRIGIPFAHVTPGDYADMSRCFHALDAYLMTSRDEGGPKALLEAMASGVPVVTTRVGQAIDLARDGENARVVQSEDVDGLVAGIHAALGMDSFQSPIVAAGLRTARENSHEAQLPKWADFFDGFVER